MLASGQLRISRNATFSRRALTLLELLVVLVILAIVATVAVNSLQPRVEAARFEQTQNQLSRVQEAVIGPRHSRQADGTPLVSGFVADIGRLPVLQLLAPSNEPGLNEGTELAELWNPQTELALSFPFQFRSGPNSPVNYSDIQLPCGWRGPYLQLPIGLSTLRDPWNRPFELRSSPDMQIQSISWQPIGDYDQPLSADLTEGKVSVTGAINSGQSSPPSFEVVMLVPNPDSSRTELVVLADEDDSPTTFSFSQVPIGLRAICITADTQRVLTKYLQVPHQGLSLVFDLTQNTSQVQLQTDE